MSKAKPKINYLAQLEKDMVLVEKGSFMMGSDEYENSQPIHKVTFEKDFYICKYPVTQGLWKVVMGDDDNPSEFKGDNRPVDEANWIVLVNDFLPKLNKLTNRKYRLPSEAEWEYAARGGKKGNHKLKFSGSNFFKEVGWFKKNSPIETKPVGLKKENQLGLFDMSGNVWEWCEDVWNDDYKNAPTDGNAWISGNHNEIKRVFRGGSWLEDDSNCLLSTRYRNYEDDKNYSNVGFRVAHD